MKTVETSLNENFRKVGYTLLDGVHVLILAKGNWADYSTLFTVQAFNGNQFVKEWTTTEFKALIRNCQLRHN